MTMQTYTVTGIPDFPGFAADLSEASATIYVLDEDGDQTPTQYQTADARHEVTRACELALLSCGREFFATPGDDRDADEIVTELVEGARIES